LEIHVGFINGSIPDLPPPVEEAYTRFVQEWVRPGADEPIKYYHSLPLDEGPLPFVFGRVYYRDIVLRKRHSVGFIYELSGLEGTRGTRAPAVYTEQREEPD